MLISEMIAHELPTETRMTRSLLARITDDMLGWKPSSELHTVGWNASHLAEIVGWIPGIVGGSEWDIAPVGGEPFKMFEAKSTSELLEAFDINVSMALVTLKGIPDSTMSEDWCLKMGGETLFMMKKGDCIRKWVFSHSAHHRGILSAYLRLAGVQFPSIYEEA